MPTKYHFILPKDSVDKKKKKEKCHQNEKKIKMSFFKKFFLSTHCVCYTFSILFEQFFIRKKIVGSFRYFQRSLQFFFFYICSIVSFFIQNFHRPIIHIMSLFTFCERKEKKRKSNRWIQ